MFTISYTLENELTRFDYSIKGEGRGTMIYDFSNATDPLATKLHIVHMNCRLVGDGRANYKLFR